MYVESTDSVALRSAADRLRNTALMIATIGVRYGRMIDDLVFEGSAADRLRVETSQLLSVVSTLVAELADEQLYLARQAGAYEEGGVG